MRFEVSTDKLAPLTSSVAKIANGRHKPILDHILITSGKDKVTLRASSGKITIERSFAPAFCEEGQFTVPARRFDALIKALPKGSLVNIESRDNKVFITCANGRYRMNSLSPADFPPTKGPQGEAMNLTLDNAIVKEAITRISTSMGVDDVRAVLNGALLHISQGKARLVATNGHCLSMTGLTWKAPAEMEAKVIIPRDVILELEKLGHEDVPLEITTDGRFLTAQCRDHRITTSLIEGNFPEYERVLPDLVGQPVTVSRDALLKAVHSANLINEDKMPGVIMEIGDAEARIQTMHKQEACENYVAIEYAGERTSIKMNAHYLMNALQSVNDENVFLHIKGPDHAALLVTRDPEAFKGVIMPMRI